MFKHALTQDVAYDSLLVQRRRELHALVGRAIEELYADRLPEHYEMLAHHFSRARTGRARWTTSSRPPRRPRGPSACGRRSPSMAKRCSRRGDWRWVPVAALAQIHRARADLFFGLGEFGRSREEGETLVELARRGHDKPAEAGALVQIAIALQWSEDFPAAYERAREAIEMAEAVDAPGPLAAGSSFVAISTPQGRLDVRRAISPRALETGSRDRDPGRKAGPPRRSLSVAGRGSIAKAWRWVPRGCGWAAASTGLPLIRGLWNQGIAWHELGEEDRRSPRSKRGSRWPKRSAMTRWARAS